MFPIYLKGKYNSFKEHYAIEGIEGFQLQNATPFDALKPR